MSKFIYGCNVYIKKIAHVLLEHKLLGGAVIYVFGNMLQKAAAFLLIPLYTYYLSPEDFGIIGVVQSVGQILTILIALGINSAVQRYYYDYYQDDSELRRYISSTFLFLMGFATVFTILILLGGAGIWKIFIHQIPFVPYAQLMIITVWGNTLTQYVSYLYRVQQKAVRFIVIQLSQFLLSTMAIIFFVVYWHLGAKGQLMGLLIGTFVVALVSSLIMLKEYFTFQFNWSCVTRSMSYGLPLIPHLSAQWVKSSLDQLLLMNYATLGEVGLYNLAYKLGMVMNVLVSSTNMAYVPYFFEMMKTDPNPEKRFQKIVAFYVIGFGTICTMLILFIGEIIHFLAPSSYYGSASAARLILFGFLLDGYYFLAVNPLFYFEKTTWIPWLTGFSALASIGMNIILIPRFGALGAAWSFVISMALTLSLVIFASRKVWKIRLPFIKYTLLNGYVLLITIWTVYGLHGDVTPILSVAKLIIGVGFLLISSLTFEESRRYLGRGFRMSFRR